MMGYLLALVLLYLPFLTSAVQDTTCPLPWPTPETRKLRESCSCQTEDSYGLRVKCSYIVDWPSSTPSNTGELLLDGTRVNTTLYSYALASFAPNLKVFSCADCGITDIKKFAFFGLNYLKTLDLKNNAIRTLNSYSFAGLRNLKEINLINSGINTIEKQAFIGLRNVFYLHLSRNPMYSIEIDAFMNVTNIEQINFNEVKAERLESYTLKGLKHIGLISFTHAEIRKIESYAFFGVDNVTTISFHSSQVRTVTRLAFVGIGKVGTIKLQSTEISTLSCEALEGLDCVRKVIWTSSPIRCDCNIQWMVELAANVSRDITKGITCASPHRFRDKNPFELEKNAMGCNDDQRFMGCPPLDTRVPRVKALERYIEDVKRATSAASSLTISVHLLYIFYFIVH